MADLRCSECGRLVTGEPCGFLHAVMRMQLALIGQMTASILRDDERKPPIANYPTQWAYDQACAALKQHRARADQAEAERDTWRDLVREFVDDGPCEYDHHDQRQGHSLDPRPCPHGRAKELLAAIGPKEDQ